MHDSASSSLVCFPLCAWQHAGLNGKTSFTLDGFHCQADCKGKCMTNREHLKFSYRCQSARGTNKLQSECGDLLQVEASSLDFQFPPLVQLVIGSMALELDSQVQSLALSLRRFVIMGILRFSSQFLHP